MNNTDAHGSLVKMLQLSAFHHMLVMTNLNKMQDVSPQATTNEPTREPTTVEELTTMAIPSTPSPPLFPPPPDPMLLSGR